MASQQGNRVDVAVVIHLEQWMARDMGIGGVTHALILIGTSDHGGELI